MDGKRMLQVTADICASTVGWTQFYTHFNLIYFLLNKQYHSVLYHVGFNSKTWVGLNTKWQWIRKSFKNYGAGMGIKHWQFKNGNLSFLIFLIYLFVKCHYSYFFLLDIFVFCTVSVWRPGFLNPKWSWTHLGLVLRLGARRGGGCCY